MKIIEDVHAEYRPELNLILLVAEFLDGTEEVMVGLEPAEMPSFANTNIPIEASDYEEWYNEALEIARRRGYTIVGEADEEVQIELNKEKQIEEMAKDICPLIEEYGNCEKCDAELDIEDDPCIYKCMAKLFASKDYRKASDVIEDMRRRFKEEAFNPNNRFDFIIDVIDEIADELKKKYLEDYDG